MVDEKEARRIKHFAKCAAGLNLLYFWPHIIHQIWPALSKFGRRPLAPPLVPPRDSSEIDPRRGKRSNSCFDQSGRGEIRPPHDTSALVQDEYISTFAPRRDKGGQLGTGLMPRVTRRFPPHPCA